MNAWNDRPLSPWFAAGLSLTALGVGHVYSGRDVLGMALFVAPFGLLPLAVIGARIGGVGAALFGMILPTVIFLVLHIAAAIDAYRAAGQAPSVGQVGPKRRAATLLYLLLIGTAYPFACYAVVRETAFEAYVIAGESMTPTLSRGDRVLVNKMARTPGRGELVIHRNPSRRDEFYVKRLVGLPGDRFDGRTVPEGCCFVLGDNAADSRDSRTYGAIPLGDVMGTVVLRLWPPSQIGGD